MSDKLDDAKQLKDGIDVRGQQVAAFLQKYLGPEEFSDYDYFIQMKPKLTMDEQEIDDKLKLGHDQLEALKKSLQS